jgi:hypothetical protein
MERVFADISQGHYEIIFKHRHPPVKRSIQESGQRFDDLAPDPDSGLQSTFGVDPVGIHIFEIAVQIDIILPGQDASQQP